MIFLFKKTCILFRDIGSTQKVRGHMHSWAYSCVKMDTMSAEKGNFAYKFVKKWGAWAPCAPVPVPTSMILLLIYKDIVLCCALWFLSNALFLCGLNCSL